MFIQKRITREEANAYLNHLIGEPLNYAWKSCDMDLYGIGFGDDVEYMDHHGDLIENATYVIHHTTAMEVYWNSGMKYYDWDTSHTKFQADVQRMLGLRVRRVGLSEKNDFWIDLGKCHMVIITLENDEESWRFFEPGANGPHLVASDAWLEIHDDIDDEDGETS